MGLEDTLLKDLVPEAARQSVPEPPMLMFPSAQLDLFQAVDPVSGQQISTLVVTAGNNALRVSLPLDPAAVARLGELFTARAAQQVAEDRPEPEYVRSAKEAWKKAVDNGDDEAMRKILAENDGAPADE